MPPSSNDRFPISRVIIPVLQTVRTAPGPRASGFTSAGGAGARRGHAKAMVHSQVSISGTRPLWGGGRKLGRPCRRHRARECGEFTLNAAVPDRKRPQISLWIQVGHGIPWAAAAFRVVYAPRARAGDCGRRRGPHHASRRQDHSVHAGPAGRADRPRERPARGDPPAGGGPARRPTRLSLSSSDHDHVDTRSCRTSTRTHSRRASRSSSLTSLAARVEVEVGQRDGHAPGMRRPSGLP